MPEDPIASPAADVALAATMTVDPTPRLGGPPDEDDLALLLHVVEPDEYVVGEELGRGGLGRVLSARHRRLGRMVALKELLPGNAGAVDRFLREAVVTARLQHPSIVPVYDAGAWPDGAPFYTMKRTEGRSLADLIAARPTLAERLALLPNVLAVADAIAYAHSQKILHRDLKPANVLVGEFGETLVIDWGLAKHASARPEDAGAVAPGRPEGATIAGTVLGTPAYMPPEQARGEPVDERADVYALGAMLYHLLAGAAPYGALPWQEKLERVVAGAPAPLAELVPDVPAELAAIVEKAMARDPAARYPSAKRLVADLSSFQTGQLVGAHRYSPAALLARWLRRHRAVVAVSALAFAALVTIGVVSLRRVIRAEGHASTRARELLFEEARALVEHDPTATLAWLRAYLDAGGDARRARVVAADAWSRGVYRRRLRQPTALRAGFFLPDGQHVVTASMEDGGLRVWDTGTGTSRAIAAPPLPAVRLDHQGAHVAGCDGEQRLLRVDLVAGTTQRLPFTCSHAADPRFSADDRLLAVEGIDEHLHIVDVDTGSERPLPVGDLAFWDVAPDGRHLAVGVAGALELWSFDRPERLRLDDAADEPGLAWSADGGHLAAAAPDGTIRVFATATGSLEASLHGPVDITDLALGPDGSQVVEVERTAPRVAQLRLWDVRSGSSRVIGRPREAYQGPELTPDGRLVVTRADAREVLVVRVDDGSAHTLAVDDAQGSFEISPDGHQVLTSNTSFLRLWPLDDGVPEVLWPHAPANTRGDATVSPDEASAAVVGPDGRVELLDLRRGSSRTLGEIALPRSRSPGLGPTNWDARVSFAPDGRWVAASSADGTIQLFPTAGGQARALVGHQGTIFGLAFTPDGRTLISAGQDGNLRLWDLASGAGSLLGSGESLRAIALSPSGRWLASGDKMGGVKLWDVSARRLARTLEGGENIVLSLAFSPDERLLAAGSYEHVVRVWDLESGRRRELTDAGNYVEVVTFSPDGKQLAYAGADRVIRVRDLGRGSVRVLRGHEAMIDALAFSPDGTRLASGEGGGRSQARLWQLDSGESRGIPHASAVKYVRWSRDGRAVYSGGYELRRWSDDVPGEAGTLRKWIDARTDLVAPRVGDPGEGD